MPTDPRAADAAPAAEPLEQIRALVNEHRENVRYYAPIMKDAERWAYILVEKITAILAQPVAAAPAAEPDGLFWLERDVDASGVSGTGRVAQGFEFADGTCALRWLTEHRSTAVYASLADVERIHGHNGSTRIVRVAAPREQPTQGEPQQDSGEQLMAACGSVEGEPQQDDALALLVPRLFDRSERLARLENTEASWSIHKELLQLSKELDK